VNQDPVAVLGELDRPVEPRAAFAASLLEACLDELQPRERRRFAWGRARLVLAVAVLLLVLAAVATATLFELRSSGSSEPAPRGALTVIVADGKMGPSAAIAVVGSSGKLRIVWRCPEHVAFCGDLTSLAWSPNGRRLAFTLDEVGGTSGYVGLHLVNLQTGRDLHIPTLPGGPHGQLAKVGHADFVRAVHLLGCAFPVELAWSPDSTRLAYTCPNFFTGPGTPSPLFVIRADGTGRFKVHTGTRTAFSPTWSADGQRLAFATEPRPRYEIPSGIAGHPRVVHSSVYVVSLDGSHRRLLATGAAGPSWSPDGATIAYQSKCGGIRLVTPEGVDMTPGQPSACPHIGVRGLPIWSPDGTLIAIGTSSATYVMRADGTGLRQATNASGQGLLGGGRPAWAPLGALARLETRMPQGAE
jgi:dipeptidyl aminopeptidase/acylaminoacyl peptidase